MLTRPKSNNNFITNANRQSSPTLGQSRLLPLRWNRKRHVHPRPQRRPADQGQDPQTHAIQTTKIEELHLLTNQVRQASLRIQQRRIQQVCTLHQRRLRQRFLCRLDRRRQQLPFQMAQRNRFLLQGNAQRQHQTAKGIICSYVG